MSKFLIAAFVGGVTVGGALLSSASTCDEERAKRWTAAHPCKGRDCCTSVDAARRRHDESSQGAMRRGFYDAQNASASLTGTLPRSGDVHADHRGEGIIAHLTAPAANEREGWNNFKKGFMYAEADSASLGATIASAEVDGAGGRREETEDDRAAAARRRETEALFTRATNERGDLSYIPNGEHLHKKMTEEYKRSQEARERAERVAAEAAAAVAAAALLREKTEESRARASENRRLASDLEDAAKQKKDAAWEAEKLAMKERAYLHDAEHDAQSKLREQERLMAAAAAHEQRARDALLKLQHEREAAVERAEEDARRRAAAAAALVETQKERAAREAAAAADARSRLEAERAAAGSRLTEAARAEASAREAAAREAAARAQADAAKQQAEAAAAQRARAESSAARARSDASSVTSRVESASANLASHEEAAARAAEAVARAKNERAKAGEVQLKPASFTDRVRAWWSSDAPRAAPVAAVSAAAGGAHAVSVPETSRLKPGHESVHVDAGGVAKVKLVESDGNNGARTGARNADVVSSTGPRNYAASGIAMAEESHRK